MISVRYNYNKVIIKVISGICKYAIFLRENYNINETDFKYFIIIRKI